MIHSFMTFANDYESNSFIAFLANAAEGPYPGKYTCYRWCGSAVPFSAATCFTGSFNLKSDGSYNFGNPPQNGRYEGPGNAFTFLNGPYKGMTGKSYTEASGDRKIDLTFHGGKFEGQKQTCLLNR